MLSQSTPLKNGWALISSTPFFPSRFSFLARSLSNQKVNDPHCISQSARLSDIILETPGIHGIILVLCNEILALEANVGGLVETQIFLVVVGGGRLSLFSELALN